MNSRIVLLGFTCVSLMAVGQSSNRESPTKASTGAQVSASEVRESPSKASTGKTAREASTGKATGKTMASDDWHMQQKPAGSQAQLKKVHDEDCDGADCKASGAKTRIVVGDVDGDGAPDAAANQNSGQDQKAINTSHSNLKSPRDAASGQASGKRQHQPVSVSKDHGDPPKN